MSDKATPGTRPEPAPTTFRLFSYQMRSPELANALRVSLGIDPSAIDDPVSAEFLEAGLKKLLSPHEVKSDA